ncbi:putative pectinesterase/pectinesterase inhibitor 32 [Quercus suber]|uniref:Pectinesterase/pectinesterase inhibitor 32 n=1 Tax=Quercus suber TaxID=58331 RepID=A0AAW0L8G7_QUESU
MQSYMSDVIVREGWLQWNESFETNLFYGEYNNHWLGASIEKWVRWLSVHMF